MNWWDDLECLSVSEICKSSGHQFWKREDSGAQNGSLQIWHSGPEEEGQIGTMTINLCASNPPLSFSFLTSITHRFY